jgi:hypothetical protein
VGAHSEQPEERAQEQAWLAAHPGDLAARSNAAEVVLTIGRFTRCRSAAGGNPCGC